MTNARAEVVVDLDAIAANTAVLRERVGRPLMAVVKADGYGHGMLPAARAALAGGADALGVAVIDEALALRAAGITGSLLATGLPAVEAAAVGAHLHGRVGQLAADRGPLLSGDLIRRLPEAVARLHGCAQVGLRDSKA